MSAFYDDVTGLCFWCFSAATGELYGIPLCDRHYGAEEQKLMADCGIL